jgi:hypothetical protein
MLVGQPEKFHKFAAAMPVYTQEKGQALNQWFDY